MAKVRTCKVCGKTYSYCPNCGKEKAPSWKVLFDEERCHEIFETLNRLNFNHITEDEAREKLNALKVNTNENFVPAIKEQIKKLFNVRKPKVVEEVVEKNVETATEQKSDIELTEKKTTSAKKSFKYNKISEVE